MRGACWPASPPRSSSRSTSWRSVASSTSCWSSSPPMAASSTPRWPPSPSGCGRGSRERRAADGRASPGHGPDLVLFHGGMGSWKHWIRNVEPLATRFTVHALDHPSYGESASVPRDTTGAAYLDLMYTLLVAMFPGGGALRFAGFSFGAAIAAHLARRFGPRVTHLCLVSP